MGGFPLYGLPVTQKQTRGYVQPNAELACAGVAAATPDAAVSAPAKSPTDTSRDARFASREMPARMLFLLSVGDRVAPRGPTRGHDGRPGTVGDRSSTGG
ncbi:hypothetical protein GCM10022379_49910 [Micromonospora maritima]